MTLTYNKSKGIIYRQDLIVPSSNILLVLKTVNNKTFVIILKDNLAIVNLPGFSIFCNLSCYKFLDEERIFTVIGSQSTIRYFAGLSNSKNRLEFNSGWSVAINPKYWERLNYQLLIFGKNTFSVHSLNITDG